ncbi:alpha/beta hydrolase [Leifsonia kafniensis]|uniref:Alpha/beta hydrolase n=1 Tax=Leifsonia kafniensis TaxID=475957 RepID=A0ABP7KMZ8_9MICO
MSNSVLEVEISRDITYRTIDGLSLQADVYRPLGRDPIASVLYLHGGGWVEGGRIDYEQTRAIKLAERGFLVASVQYRFAQDAPFPAQLDDIRAAVAWLRGKRAEFGVVSEKVGAWGSSAGGHLAALLALGNPGTGERPDVDAAVTWFAPLDVGFMTGGTEMEQEMFGPNPVNLLVGGEFDLADPSHQALDPLALVSAAAAPMLLVTGDRDRVIDASVSERMFRALSRARAQVQLYVVAGAGHEDAALETAASLGLVAGFFEAELGTNAPLTR